MNHKIDHAARTAFRGLYAQGLLDGKAPSIAKNDAIDTLARHLHLEQTDLRDDAGLRSATWKHTKNEAGVRRAQEQLKAATQFFEASSDELRSDAGALLQRAAADQTKFSSARAIAGDPEASWSDKAVALIIELHGGVDAHQTMTVAATVGRLMEVVGLPGTHPKAGSLASVLTEVFLKGTRPDEVAINAFAWLSAQDRDRYGIYEERAREVIPGLLTSAARAQTLYDSLKGEHDELEARREKTTDARERRELGEEMTTLKDRLEQVERAFGEFVEPINDLQTRAIRMIAEHVVIGPIEPPPWS
jgi:hypothetical protein